MVSHADQINCVDCSLKDICKVDKPFGGIPTGFGRDPKQILPRVHYGD